MDWPPKGRRSSGSPSVVRQYVERTQGELTLPFLPGPAQGRLKFPSLVQFVVPGCRQSSRGPSTSSPIGCCDVSHFALHTEAARHGRRHGPGSCAVRRTGLRFGRVRTRCEIGTACDGSGTGAPRFGAGERPRCGGTTPGVAARASGLRHRQGDCRDTGSKAAKAVYRKLPAAPADLCAGAVQCPSGFSAGDGPITKMRVARTHGGGARHSQRWPYRSLSDKSSRHTPRPWVAA